MNQREKKKFLRDLTKNVLAEVLQKVAIMPEEWDGHELRQYLAYYFGQCASALMEQDRRRMRAFKNELNTRPL